ncbi:MAG TPA: FGGY family carbohydrate kinase, partial [Candidatus Limnocylindrales bacterium]|nr:FGGY family carbohydrate kinase [Candidatus Limnocylindrales bacterium]
MTPQRSARGAAGADAGADPEDAGGREVLVALDIGTSGARAVSFDLEGVRHLEVRRGYPTDSPRSGWAEQDPGRWRSAGLGALGELVARLGPRRRVLAIGLTGQCPSVVLLDAAHRPLTPGLIYRDNRATTEAAWLRDTFGAEALHARTGHLPAAFHIAPKLRWLQRHA